MIPLAIFVTIMKFSIKAFGGAVVEVEIPTRLPAFTCMCIWTLCLTVVAICFRKRVL